jgi:hypothetical protein
MATNDELRGLISSALSADGRAGGAALAGNPSVSMIEPYTELPGGVSIIRVDAMMTVSASFYIGLVGRRVFYLTQSPEGFSAMLRAAGLRVTTPGVAVSAAALFVETTRSMRQFSGVVASPDDITWSPSASPETLAAVAGRLRSVIRPPAAANAGANYEVTLYAIRGATLERRRLHVTPDGDVREEVVPVEDGLPVPYSM